MSNMLINLMIQILNVLVAVLGLALILRVVLPWLRVSRGHPVMQLLITVTEPIVRPVRGFLGHGGFRRTRGGSIDLAPVVTFFILWLAQAIITRLLLWIAVPPLWLFQPTQNLERWLVGVIGLLIQLYTFMLLVRILLEWLRVSYTQPVLRFLWNVTEPLLRPIRRRLPTFAGLDFSPVVTVLFLAVVQMLVVALIRTIF